MMPSYLPIYCSTYYRSFVIIIFIGGAMGRAGYIAVRPNNKKKDCFNLDFNGRSF